jgi:nucleoside-diphosphate-sugar epimerase
MRALVTGAAGFVGSHLCERLVAADHEVVAVDCFTPAYDVAEKVANLGRLRSRAGFRFEQLDLRSEPLDRILEGIDTVFHLAALAGVRASWDYRFAEYATHNVLATQRLLEASRRAGVARVVYASSSSVYGNATVYPTDETVMPAPFSPYGVTKLAGEHLCVAYAQNFGLHTVALRYFTVFGSRQRPDMGIRRLVQAALAQQVFEIYGDGCQRREFTHVRDVVDANLLAATRPLVPGLVCNIAGGGDIALNDLIDLVSEMVGRRVPTRHVDAVAGDVRRNGGDTALARETLGWRPQVSLGEGLDEQIAWQRSLSSTQE